MQMMRNAYINEDTYFYLSDLTDHTLSKRLRDALIVGIACTARTNVFGTKNLLNEFAHYSYSRYFV